MDAGCHRRMCCGWGKVTTNFGGSGCGAIAGHEGAIAGQGRKVTTNLAGFHCRVPL